MIRYTYRFEEFIGLSILKFGADLVGGDLRPVDLRLRDRQLTTQRLECRVGHHLVVLIHRLLNKEDNGDGVWFLVSAGSHRRPTW